MKKITLWKIISKPFIKLRNKRLLKKYPFLLYHPEYNEGPEFSDYFKKHMYERTFLDTMPHGWRKAFGKQFCESILTECHKFGIDPKEAHIDDIKEKWGVLTISYSCPNEVDLGRVMDYYEDLSMLYCINCGKITKYETSGWINYICEDCAKKYKGRKLYRLTVPKYVPKRVKYNEDWTSTTDIPSEIPFEKFWPKDENLDTK